jgi:Domain of unknown function (DUF4279)
MTGRRRGVRRPAKRKSDSRQKNTGHRYTVELRVWGETLDPEQVTRTTGLRPCQTRHAGTRRGSQSIHTQSMWAFDGEGDKGGRDWRSLEGITFVLDRLAGTEQVFAKLMSKYDVGWWCGHFQSRFDGGPELSAGLLERLGTFGASLFIDNYFHPPNSGS